MSIVDLTVREKDFDTLRTLVRREDGSRSISLCTLRRRSYPFGPLGATSRCRLTVHEVLPVPEEDKISASRRHVTWSTASYVKLLKRAKDEGLVPGIVHTHPNGPASFSEQDDRNETDLVQLACNRNGEDGRLVSILLTGDTQVKARLWPDIRDPIDAVSVRVVGRRFTVHPLTHRILRILTFLRVKPSLW